MKSSKIKKLTLIGSLVLLPLFSVRSAPPTEDQTREALAKVQNIVKECKIDKEGWGHRTEIMKELGKKVVACEKKPESGMEDVKTAYQALSQQALFEQSGSKLYGSPGLFHTG